MDVRYFSTGFNLFDKSCGVFADLHNDLRYDALRVPGPAPG